MKDLFVGAMPFSDKHRAMVRIRAPLFNPITVRAAVRLLPTSTVYSLYEMANGGDVLDHVMLVFTCAYFALIYGTSLDAFRPSYVRDTKSLFALLGATFSPDCSIADIFPALEYVPGVSWMLKGRAAALLSPLISGTKGRVEEALRIPSWKAVQAVRAKPPPDTTTDEFCISLMELEAVPAAMSLTMCGIMKRSLEQPDAMAKVRAGLDRQVGPGRLPTQDDIPHLPYFNAFIQETIRLGNLTPLSLPRAPVHDDEHIGYRIPKDPLVFAFQHGLNTDETIFKNPMVFDPSRWIDYPTLPKPALFGFGKRACPGKAFVADTIALTMARMLWGYDFKFRKDAQVHKFVDNLTFHIDSTENVEYACKSDAHWALIEQAHKDADVELSASLEEVRALF
ncbi:hypothetical protein OQA88_13072 [Cercophora sp. LCS_1]